MKRIILTFLGVLLILSASGCSRADSAPTADVQPPATPEATPAPWETVMIERYGLLLEIPEGWNLEENNLRAQPAGFSNILDGQCADYKVTNFSGAFQLAILPHCGPEDWALGPVPEGAVIVKEKPNQDFIIRYYVPGRSIYSYTNASMTPAAEGTQPLVNFCAIPPVVSIGEGQNPVLVVIELKISKLTTDLEDELATADRIVASLRVDSKENGE